MNSTNYHIKSFNKIISILKIFSAEKPENDLKAIQQAVPVNKTTLYRMMANLVEQELLEKNPLNQNYKLGPLLLRLGFAAWHNFELRDVVAPIIKDLASKSGQTVHLSQRHGKEILYLDRHEGADSLIVKSRIGAARPIYSTASGKVSAAYLDKDKLAGLLSEIEFRPFTKNTITDPKVLKEQLKEIRERGYAVDNREHNNDVSCVAVPVWGTSQKVIAGISISGPFFHFDSKSIPRFVQQAKAAAEKIHSEILKRGIKI